MPAASPPDANPPSKHTQSVNLPYASVLPNEPISPVHLINVPDAFPAPPNEVTPPVE